ncbi:uncharacterized protein PV09_08524 [Verruconis gallopava]|uniref:ABC transporter domain-containing protein n=1 Tax=Verruconis gallopava TaxID=253628 RepID=A0A0D1YGD3_9PEZI|nr:uncharacterized protein PV09_08524 [Verruconis gallopava]KIV99856.1 hypothetical protein PV09_08524 [Verruconis gallopava]
MTFNIPLDDVQRVDIEIEDLTVEVDSSPSFFKPATYLDFYHRIRHGRQEHSKKRLLDSITCSLKAGTLTAIIGGSGSGKTTLLNAVSQWSSNSRISSSGSIRYNGIEGLSKIRHAFVMQHDILLPTLTVRETLTYSADLRLSPSLSRDKKQKVVEEVILELSLKDCANTRIGDYQRRGCSGGEKRRTSIGVQLLANPSVLFLDEPTTGLDATTAFQLVKTLKSLTKKGRTVITTVHQPRSEMWGYFDNLIILSKGGTLIYSGPSDLCIPWFESLGHPLPSYVNPFDFLADLVAIDDRSPDLQRISMRRVEGLRKSWKEYETRHCLTKELAEKFPVQPDAKIKSRKESRWLLQTRVLTARTLLTTYRDPMGMASSIIEAVVMGITCGLIFFRVPRTLSGIKSRQGAMYSVGGLQGYLFLIFETYRLTVDMPGFDRENKEGCIDVIPFLLSRRLARLFTEDLPVPIIFSLIFYFMVGFDIERFPTFLLIVILNHFIAVTCAQTCVATIRHFAGASLIANSVYTLQTLAAGYFIQSNSIPAYLRWTKYITYNYYVFTGFCANEFENNFYDCPNPQRASSPECIQYTGRYILSSLGIPARWKYQPILAQLAFIVFFCILNAAGLRFLKVNLANVKYRTSQMTALVNPRKLDVKSQNKFRRIAVNVENFCLEVEQKSIKGTTTKRIFSPITATFQPGMINVIMGPSGSGKTSLLNSIALRLQDSARRKHKLSGKLTFNGATPTSNVIKSICSYVAQDDDGLFPSLTVRETLRFAAEMRLPSWMTSHEKTSRAETIMLKLGLKDCADTQIGSEIPPVKGISGGEKRRTTIATQILTNPRIILLDEPTSGLDAFTANSIMEGLQELAAEGCTVITTIHQARSDIFFNFFGNVLLLTRGGLPVYSGSSSNMLSYFASLGYDCPQHTNPADFAVDLITIDLQETQREATSRERVVRLTEAWKNELSLSQKVEGKSHDSTMSVMNVISTTSSTEMITESHTNPGALEELASCTASISTPAELGALCRSSIPLGKILPVLLHRSITNFRRQPHLLIARTMQVMGLAILLTLFLAPLGDDFASVQNHVGFVQNISAFYFIGVLQNLAVYPAERDVFYLENDDGLYGVEAFILCYTLLEIPYDVSSCLLAGVFCVFAVGLSNSATVYFVYAFSCFSIVCSGESLGLIFNTLFARHPGLAINIPTVLVALAQVLAGSMSVDMPGFLKKMNLLSPCRYAIRAVAHYAILPKTFTCNNEQRLPDGECAISTGQQVLDLYDLNGPAAVNVALLAVLVVAYRVVAWFALRLARMNKNGGS